MDLRHQDAAESSREERGRMKSRSKQDLTPDVVELGIDLKEFYKSVEWDILGVPASRNVKATLKYQFIVSGITFSVIVARLKDTAFSSPSP